MAEEHFVFNIDLFNESMKNKRTAPRYVRNDIAVFICNDFPLSILSITKKLDISLIDINSKGALISVQTNLSVKKKLTLKLIFNCGRSFKIKSRVIHKSGSTGHEYGLKFACYNDELGDFLVATQKNLIVK